eukprot:CAMPEP_0172159198 /NCGR_PEP_ID=MMETSP1050-20130122/4825_1 /TAXON_ID=233186 /ORGANISM="Cryptomonas curvata, Strain CCAP979/52" /LENGTH=353 /DNA_ID=CAMNT_0012828735 /DNA_START=83 /DNA_END=1140 /DNA_ORIENTATION=-
MNRARKETPEEYAQRQKRNLRNLLRKPITIATNPPLLYVDLLNFTRTFLGIKPEDIGLENVDIMENCRIAEKNVKMFMLEAAAAGWKVTVFIDNVKILPEEIDLSKKRTEDKLVSGGCGNTIINMVFGKLFSQFGARVCFSLAADNDPTLAAHAAADDAAVLSGDGDFLRYFGKRDSGETFFLRRLYLKFAMGDECNAGRLALSPRRPPKDRMLPNWTYKTQHADKGGKVRLLRSPPTTSPAPEVVTRRDAAGAPLFAPNNNSTYPFAFPCAPACNAQRLMRPLRLACYGLLGESRVVESTLGWSRSGGDSGDYTCYVPEWRERTWSMDPAGNWSSAAAGGGGEPAAAAAAAA